MLNNKGTFVMWVLVVCLFSNAVAAAWWDSGYSYRYSIINNATSLVYPYVINDTSCINGNCIHALIGNGSYVYSTAPECSGTLAIADETTEKNWFNSLDCSGYNPSLVYDALGVWCFDVNSGNQTIDCSGHGNTGTIYGVIDAPEEIWVAGKVGNAIYFGPRDNWVNCGNSSSVNSWGAGNFSIDAWIKQTTNAVQDIIFKGNPSGKWGSFTPRSSTDNQSLWLQMDDAVSCKNWGGTSDVIDGTWRHVIVTFEYDGIGFNRTIYIDGVQDTPTVNSYVVTGRFNTTYPLTLGKCTWGGDPGGGSCYNYDGFLDELHIYGRVLTASEALQSYQRGLLGLPSDVSATGLIGYWAFDETSGVNASDSSGNDNHGTLYNFNVTKSAVYGNAIAFDGTSNYIDCGDNFNSSNVITLEAWAKSSTAQANKGIIERGTVGVAGSYDYMMYFHNNDIYFFMKDSGSVEDYLLTPFNFHDGVWHHYVMLFDGDYFKIYVDGSLIASKNTTLTDIRVGNGTLHIGRYTNSFFQGVIDEVRVYNRSLPPKEIMERYQNGNNNRTHLGVGETLETTTIASHEEKGVPVYICGDHYCTVEELMRQGIIPTTTLRSQQVGLGYIPQDITSSFTDATIPLPFIGPTPILLIVLLPLIGVMLYFLLWKRK